VRKTNNTNWTKKDLLDLENLTKEEIELILQTAASFKEVSREKLRKFPPLEAKP
jgi:aspartate carbamoyltransferase catalytic subunit